MWTQFGLEDAGRELVRALHSNDPDIAVLASALLEWLQGRSEGWLYPIHRDENQRSGRKNSWLPIFKQGSHRQ